MRERRWMVEIIISVGSSAEVVFGDAARANSSGVVLEVLRAEIR
jgi:hypothetical protein